MKIILVEFLKWLLGTSVFGVMVGFLLSKWGTAFEENRTEKKVRDQLLRNLLQEISNNRFRCQAISQGRDATYFERFSWDNLRLNKAISFLSNNRQLLDGLYNLYLFIDQGNLRVGAVLTALDANIRTGQLVQSNAINTTSSILRDFVNNVLLPQLNNLEGDFSRFLKDNKLIS